MSLSLSCTCGARFEVEETFAGQEVSCPECQRLLKAPSLQHTARRTSGFAIASVILALAGAFTVIGTLAAVGLGIAALISIGRHRDRLAGAGYAVFGIIWGLLFTVLALFAYSSSELFGVNAWMRESRLAGQVNYDGPLEVIEPGFTITRPSEKWGVSQVSPDPDFWPDDKQRAAQFILINVAANALVDVTGQSAPNLSLEQWQERVLGWFGGSANGPGKQDALLGFSQCKLRHSRRVQPRGDCEAIELLLDVRYSGEARTYLVRIVKHDLDLFVVRGWTQKRRFAQTEPEIRKALDSFRVLDN